MNRQKVDRLEDLLEPHIDNKKIIDTKITQLTAPGENYGGLLLKVDVSLKNKDGTTEELNVVAKSIPENEFLQKVFDVQLSFRKEIAFYDTIVPLLQQFQTERGMEDVIQFCAKKYGSRLNLNGSDVVDENGTILLENLVQSGYRNANRFEGFDLDTMKLVLKELATLHGVALAFKILKPDVFEEKIKPHLVPLKPPSSDPGSGGGPDTPHLILMEFLESVEEFRPLWPVLSENLDFKANLKQMGAAPRPLFTITHNDLWLNNIMVKSENGKCAAVKFVDFQNYGFKSPVNDLLFLLWTSVQQSLLDTEFDNLLRIYYDDLVGILARLNCEHKFTFEVLIEEIKTDCKFVLGQALFMSMFVVFNKKAPEIDKQDPGKPPSFGNLEDVSAVAKERIILIVRKCIANGWL
ncbi:hypothetical protein NQ317_012181 [Molorchus minor]|uniref:CHK kinase-like domain-containing protein n=1 Tax=Molorchus minor TaxID=1323400 RepID=A0ABQ9K2T1_9CUCU|nr:hypothetical protein NQ317_012181 [Molorchus minor]